MKRIPVLKKTLYFAALPFQLSWIGSTQMFEDQGEGLSPSFSATAILKVWTQTE